MRHHSVWKRAHCGGLMSTAAAACKHAGLPGEEQCVGRLGILLTTKDKDAIISIHIPAQAWLNFVRANAPPRAEGSRFPRSAQELQVSSAEAAAVAALQGPGSHIAARLSV